MSLCPEAEYRASLDDGDFWAYVLQGIRPDDPTPEVDMLGDYPMDDLQLEVSTICPVCQSVNACGYDNEGRPWIHCTESDE